MGISSKNTQIGIAQHNKNKAGVLGIVLAPSAVLSRALSMAASMPAGSAKMNGKPKRISARRCMPGGAK